MRRVSEPPVMLVKTWIYLVASSESQEVIDRASAMLFNAFETIEHAMEFCRNKEGELPDQV